MRLFKRVRNTDVKQALRRLVCVWNNFLPFLIPWQHYLQQNLSYDTKACTISWTPCLFLNIARKVLVPRIRTSDGILRKGELRLSGNFRRNLSLQYLTALARNRFLHSQFYPSCFALTVNVALNCSFRNSSLTEGKIRSLVSDMPKKTGMADRRTNACMFISFSFGT